MKTWIKAFAFVVLVIVGVLSGYGLTLIFAPKPRISVDSFDKDIGLVQLPVEVPKVYFHIRNTGNAPLILEINREDGFRDVALLGPQVEPGEEVTLRGIFEVSEEDHRLEGTIGLGTNDPRHPSILLHASGEVGRYLRHEPKEVFFETFPRSPYPSK